MHPHIILQEKHFTHRVAAPPPPTPHTHTHTFFFPYNLLDEESPSPSSPSPPINDFSNYVVFSTTVLFSWFAFFAFYLIIHHDLKHIQIRDNFGEIYAFLLKYANCVSLSEAAVRRTVEGASAPTSYGNTLGKVETWDAHKIYGCICNSYRYIGEHDFLNYD